MKLTSSSAGPRRARQRQRGMAVVLVLTLLSILLIYMAGNIRALHSLDQELKLTERRQVKRLNALSAANAPAATRAAITNAAPAVAPAPPPAP